MEEHYREQMSKSGPESLPLNQQVKFDVLIQIEALTGCYHNCVGCFVDKNLDASISTKLLNRAKELTDGVTRTGLNLREFVIGPTDFFSAANTSEILNSKITQSILFEHENARIANPARFDEATDEQFNKIFAILDDETKFRKDMIIEFIQPLPEDIMKMVNDKEYFDVVMKRIEFFKFNTPKMIDWSWTLQSSSILARKLSKDDYTSILNKSIDEYGTILEMNPAFTRAPSIELQKSNLLAWNGFLSAVIDESNSKKATMSMANLYCNSMNFVGITIYPGENGEIKTLLNVMLHEQALFTQNKNLDVTGLTFEEILVRREELAIKGIQKFSEHPLYKDTPYVNALAYRLAYEAIETMGLDDTEAILPMDVLAMYNPEDTRDAVFNNTANKIRNKDI